MNKITDMPPARGPGDLSVGVTIDTDNTIHLSLMSRAADGGQQVLLSDAFPLAQLLVHDVLLTAAGPIAVPPLRHTSTSGWLQTVPAPATTLQWENEPRQAVVPVLHVGNSSFESWFARRTTDWELGAAKQIARDSYAAGMGDPLVMPRKIDRIAEMHGEVVDADFPGTPTIAECIAQLDVWNGHLEAAIDRQAHEKLGQHANDAPAAGGRDPMEQLP